MGVEIGSDWQDKEVDDPRFGLYRTCGFWTRGETELLRDISGEFVGGHWLEVGAHTGWCTAALCEGGVGCVTAIEPMFGDLDWYRRFIGNVDGIPVRPFMGRSDQYFAIWDGGGGRTFDGCLIDGDHEGGNPLNDAICCFDRLNERGVILLHDFRGPEVWDAAKYLVDRGMKWRIYPSVHMVFAAWRGEFDPPLDRQEGDRDWAAHYGLPGWAA
jgi:hypothetical protein